MSRIPTHTLDSAPSVTRPVLEAFAQRSPSGKPINMHAQMAHAPAVLLGYMATRQALDDYTARTFPMSAAERKVYLAPYASRAARRNPVLLLADLAGNQGYMQEIEHGLQTRLHHLPVLLMWGDKDPVYEFMPRFQRIFPDARTLTIPGAHPFRFAEAPDQMIAEIRHWWQLASVASESTRRVSS